VLTVQARAIVAREYKPPKPIKFQSVQGLDVGPEEMKAKQKAEDTLKKYWSW